MKTTGITAILILASALLVGACKKGETPSAGDFKVRMTDAPGDYEALMVEVEAVEVYSENAGWIMLNNESQLISVLDLTNGAETQLAFKQNVEVGTYSKLRLKFGDENKLTVKSTIELGGVLDVTLLELDLGLEGPNEIEIAINEQVSASGGADILIDFDVARSIVKQGEEYVLKPLITEIKNEKTGLKGEVSGAAGAALILTNGSDSTSAYTNVQGEFLFRGIQPGTYSLTAYPEQKDGEPRMAEKRIEGVLVKEGRIESAGTIEF